MQPGETFQILFRDRTGQLAQPTPRHARIIEGHLARGAFGVHADANIDFPIIPQLPFFVPPPLAHGVETDLVHDGQQLVQVMIRKARRIHMHFLPELLMPQPSLPRTAGAHACKMFPNHRKRPPHGKAFQGQ